MGDPIAGQSAFVRFKASRFNVEGAALDARGLPCEGLACPACHLLVPRAFLESGSLIFSIIGIPASGKSYLLAAMSWELRSLLPKRFSIAFNDADPLNNLILNEAENTLFLQDDLDAWVALRKTEMEGEMYDRVHMDTQSVLLPHPFLFTLRPTGAHPAANSAAQATRILCFYDNAGENFQPGQDSATSPGTQHLARSKIPRFRKRCRQLSKDPQLSVGRTADRQDAVLTEAALRIRTYARLSSNQKLDKPLLVLVAKADIWGRLINEDFREEPLIAPGQGGGQLTQVDLARVDAMSQKVRALLLEHSPEFVAAAEDAFQPVVYIPVSALGGSPTQKDSDGPLLVRPKDISPRWVTVPVLYAFARWSSGLIEKAKT